VVVVVVVVEVVVVVVVVVAAAAAAIAVLDAICVGFGSHWDSQLVVPRPCCD